MCKNGLHPFIILLALVLLASCRSYEKVVYLQSAGTRAVFSGEEYLMPEAVIREGDLLVITVNTNNPDAAVPFNLPLVPAGANMTYSMRGTSNLALGFGLQNYLVNAAGMLTFPVIGEIRVAGLTKSQLSDKLKEQIYPRYLTEEPIILIRVANFQVSVLGEVSRPGSFTIDNERVTILEALALAGDMTIFGNRSDVLLVREREGRREAVRLDLRDKQLIHSPYFYLQQNDVLYVEPNAPRQRAAGISTAETLSISVIGTLISLTTLLINILR